MISRRVHMHEKFYCQTCSTLTYRQATNWRKIQNVLARCWTTTSYQNNVPPQIWNWMDYYSAKDNCWQGCPRAYNIYLFSEHSHPVDRNTVALEETKTKRIKLFHCKIKAIDGRVTAHQCRVLLNKLDKWTQTLSRGRLSGLGAYCIRVHLLFENKVYALWELPKSLVGC